jgi:hypothetical protein
MQGWVKMLVYALGYAAFGWLPILTAERAAFYAEYRRWAGQVALSSSGSGSGFGGAGHRG